MTDDAWPALAEQVRAQLDSWSPVPLEQQRLRAEYLAFVARLGPDAVRREGGPEHLTASCFVLSPDRTAVLLTLHRKARRWLQLGGHLEPGDHDPGAAALREAVEEGGVAGLRLDAAHPVDVDRHALGGAFGRCRVHWDIGYLAVADERRDPVVSDESEDVRWWPVDGLAAVAPDVARRLQHVLP